MRAWRAKGERKVTEVQGVVTEMQGVVTEMQSVVTVVGGDGDAAGGDDSGGIDGDGGCDINAASDGHIDAGDKCDVDKHDMMVLPAPDLSSAHFEQSPL